MDHKVVEAIAGSESGKSTLLELAQEIGIKMGELYEHLVSMMARHLLMSYENELNGEVYYKLAYG